MQDNFASIKDFVKQCLFKGNFLVSRLNSVTLDVSYSKQCGNRATKIQNRDARMPQGKKGRREVPRTASSANASLQRCKNFLVASNGRNVTGAVPGQEDGNDRGGHEDATKCKEKEVKTVQSSTTCGGCRQWCLKRPEHIAPLYAWQEDVEASVVKTWQIPSFCHFLVAGPSCLTEPSVFRTVDLQGRIDFRGVPQGSASPSSNTQTCKTK